VDVAVWGQKQRICNSESIFAGGLILIVPGATSALNTESVEMVRTGEPQFWWCMRSRIGGSQIVPRACRRHMLKGMQERHEALLA
jgi:hypothetical protein